MSLTFYYGSGSPYSWRVFLALEHKRVPYEPELLSFSKGEHRSPEYSKVNPRHQVPAITDGDFSLYESSAILEYLEERFPEGPSLFPGDVHNRALVRRLIAEADHHMGSKNEKLVAEFFFKQDPQARNREVIEKATKALRFELEWLEATLERDFAAGEPSAADFTLYPFVVTHARFELRDPDLGLTAARGPRTRAWMARIEALPYFDKTYPPHWRG
jgi:glutathione S-transferase